MLLADQQQTIRIQSGKINRHDSLYNALSQAFHAFNHKHPLRSPNQDLFENISAVLDAYARLRDSLAFQTAKNKVIVADLNALQSELEAKNALAHQLKLKKDSMGILIN